MFITKYTRETCDFIAVFAQDAAKAASDNPICTN